MFVMEVSRDVMTASRVREQAASELKEQGISKKLIEVPKFLQIAGRAGRAGYSQMRGK